MIGDAARVLLSGAVDLVLRMTGLRAGVALIYHEVTPGPPGPPDTRVTPTISAAGLAEHLSLLRRRYEVVAAVELLDAARRRRRGDPFPVAITFDDDLRSHVDVALPVLKAGATTATFFLTGASLDGPSLFWWEQLQRAIDDGRLTIPPSAADRARQLQELPPSLRAAEIVELRDGEELPQGLRRSHVRLLREAGCDVGFHTRSHEVLTDLDASDLATALTGGRDELASAVAGPLLVLAYPHGAADGRVARAAAQAGFRVAFTTDRTAVTASTDPMLLGRVYPDTGSAGRLAWQLAGAIWRARR